MKKSVKAMIPAAGVAVAAAVLCRTAAHRFRARETGGSDSCGSPTAVEFDEQLPDLPYHRIFLVPLCSDRSQIRISTTVAKDGEIIMAEAERTDARGNPQKWCFFDLDPGSRLNITTVNDSSAYFIMPDHHLKLGVLNLTAFSKTGTEGDNRKA